MLAPQQATVLVGEGGDLIGDLADHRLLGGVLHVQRRAHVQHAGIDMPEHAIAQATGIQRGAEFGDVIGQMLRRNGGVLDEGQRAGFAVDIAQQAHRALAHAIDTTDLRATAGFGEAETLDAGIAGQVLAEGADLGIQHLFAVGIEFDQVDTADGRGAFGAGREEFLDAIPHEVLHGEVEHGVIHRLDGGRAIALDRHQRLGVAQCVHEACVAQVDQRRAGRDGQRIQLGLDHEAQRALGAAQQAVEVETTIGLAQVGEVVAGQAAVERRKDVGDFLGALIGDRACGAVDLTDAILTCTQCLELGIIDGMARQPCPVEQDAVERQHVVTRLAVFAAALTGGIGIDHAANGGAVGGRELRGEEQPMRLERGIQLVLHHAGLDAHATVLDIDLENAVHVPRDIHQHAVIERLAIGAGTAAAWRQGDARKAWLVGEARDALDILGMARVDHGLRQHLIERVVGRQHGAVGVVRTDVTGKACISQGGQEVQIEGIDGGGHIQQAFGHDLARAVSRVRQASRANGPKLT